MKTVVKYESTNYINRKNIQPYAENPWLNELATKMTTKKNYTAFAGRSVDVVDHETGEVSQGLTYVGTTKEVDKEEFVKVYASGFTEFLSYQKKHKNFLKS